MTSAGGITKGSGGGPEPFLRAIARASVAPGCPFGPVEMKPAASIRSPGAFRATTSSTIPSHWTNWLSSAPLKNRVGSRGGGWGRVPGPRIVIVSGSTIGE